jgi:hypothetical protein
MAYGGLDIVGQMGQRPYAIRRLLQLLAHSSLQIGAALLILN